MPSRIPTPDWMKSKLDRLLEMTEIVRKESPEQYSADPTYGFWSIKKEIALMYWSYPFQQIAKHHFKSFYYIDLFAGSGLMKAEETFFVGSPIVAVGSALKDQSFSQYICIEANKARKVALEKRMQTTCSYLGTYGAKIYQADCNAQLEDILRSCCPPFHTCFLAFVDPQGYTELKWETLERLMRHGIGDIILNFPTMGINRNLAIPENAPAISDFIGDDNWKGCTIDEILEHFKCKVFEHRTVVDSLEIRDEQNRRLYDLVFATNSQGMKNALDDLKTRLNLIQAKTIRGLYAVAAEGQKQLRDFFQNNDSARSFS